MLEARGHGVAPAVLGERQLGATPPHLDRVHDLVGLAQLQDAVLVDTRTVGESVLADDRLAPLHVQSAHAADNARGFQNFACVHVRVQFAEDIRPRLERHDDFLERDIAGALADSVDRALDLTRTVLNGGQRVRHRQSEIVVAVHAYDGVVDIADIVLQILDQRAELLRDSEADGVRDIHRGGARRDGGFDDLREKLGFGARGILGREFDILCVRLRQLHTLGGESQDFLVRFLELVLAVDFRRGEKNVDASALAGGFHCGGGGLDVLRHAARQPRNDRASYFRGDALHRLEIAFADHRESGLDHIDIEPRQLAGNLQLLAQVH